MKSTENRRTLLLAIAAAGTMIALVPLWSFLERMAGEKAGAAERFAYVHSCGAPKLWRVPTFSYPDQLGKEISSESLLGKPWIADFIFTQCTSACPLMTSKMVMLQRALAGTEIHFVSFSVDPKHDSPSALLAYASKWNPLETRWRLLSTDTARLEKTVAGFRVTAMASGNEADPIVHSSVFFLVDAEGWVRGVYDSGEEAARVRLLEDVRSLAPKVTREKVQDGGTSLYSSLGCAGCHQNTRIAPSLEGLLGSNVHLEGGMSLVADADYIRRSIEEPDEQIVAGYPTKMPSYSKHLSAAQIDQLVREIEGMSGGPQTRNVAEAKVVVDPVCKMKVRADGEALHVSHAGDEVYFCSESCRDAFALHPERFAVRAIEKEAKKTK